MYLINDDCLLVRLPSTCDCFCKCLCLCLSYFAFRKVFARRHIYIYNQFPLECNYTILHRIWANFCLKSDMRYQLKGIRMEATSKVTMINKWETIKYVVALIKYKIHIIPLLLSCARNVLYVLSPNSKATHSLRLNSNCIYIYIV